MLFIHFKRSFELEKISTACTLVSSSFFLLLFKYRFELQEFNLNGNVKIVNYPTFTFYWTEKIIN